LPVRRDEALDGIWIRQVTHSDDLILHRLQVAYFAFDYRYVGSHVPFP
jgi:hypothetical protein